MKKLILTLMLFFAIQNLTFSQSVNGVQFKDIDVEYVQIVGTKKPFTQKVFIEIDFGQENKLFSNRDTRIVDEKGINLIFNSMIDALNFMNKNGYDFVTAYTVTIGDQNVYHYLLKKRKQN
jgi:hypothetical protein